MLVGTFNRSEGTHNMKSFVRLTIALAMLVPLGALAASPAGAAGGTARARSTTPTATATAVLDDPEGAPAAVAPPQRQQSGRPGGPGSGKKRPAQKKKRR